MEIQLQQLSKSYQDMQVMNGLELHFDSDTIYCLFGPSGCGKTTLLQILTGMIEPDAGTVEGVRGKRFSYIFQEDRLLPWATVEENIQFVLGSRYEKSESKKIAEHYVSLVNLLNFKNHKPNQISGGMKQRVAIARALAYQGDVLIMDEPFKGLDFEIKKQLMDYIIQYGRLQERIIIFVTHDIDEALYMADVVMQFTGPSLTLKGQIPIRIPHAKRFEEPERMNEYRKQIVFKE